MDLSLRHKIAVVTGASEGIGKAIAIGLARENAKVAICARRSDVLSATAVEIRDSTGADVLAIPLVLGNTVGSIIRLPGHTYEHNNGHKDVFSSIRTLG